METRQSSSVGRILDRPSPKLVERLGPTYAPRHRVPIAFPCGPTERKWDAGKRVTTVIKPTFWMTLNLQSPGHAQETTNKVGGSYLFATVRNGSLGYGPLFARGLPRLLR